MSHAIIWGCSSIAYLPSGLAHNAPCPPLSDCSRSNRSDPHQVGHQVGILIGPCRRHQSQALSISCVHIHQGVYNSLTLGILYSLFVIEPRPRALLFIGWSRFLAFYLEITILEWYQSLVFALRIPPGRNTQRICTRFRRGQSVHGHVKNEQRSEAGGNKGVHLFGWKSPWQPTCSRLTVWFPNNRGCNQDGWWCRVMTAIFCLMLAQCPRWIVWEKGLRSVDNNKALCYVHVFQEWEL